MLSKVWIGFLTLSLIFGIITGRLDAVSSGQPLLGQHPQLI